METDEEIKVLRAEIARLEAEKNRLKQINELKKTKLISTIKNIPEHIRAAHPYLSALTGMTARGVGKGAVEVGKGTMKLLDYMARNIEAQEKAERQRKKLEAYG